MDLFDYAFQAPVAAPPRARRHRRSPARVRSWRGGGSACGVRSARRLSGAWPSEPTAIRRAQAGALWRSAHRSMHLDGVCAGPVLLGRLGSAVARRAPPSSRPRAAGRRRGLSPARPRRGWRSGRRGGARCRWRQLARRRRRGGAAAGAGRGASPSTRPGFKYDDARSASASAAPQQRRRPGRLVQRTAARTAR